MGNQELLCLIPIGAVWQLIFAFTFDPVIVSYVDKLGVGDFSEDGETGIWIDKDSLSWGIKSVYMPLVHFSDIAKYIVAPDGGLDSRSDYIRNFRWNQSPIKASNYATIYYVYVATLDKLVVERDKHDVEQHDLRLSNGRKIMVRRHTRRNPVYIRGRRTLLEDIDYIVYVAADSHGTIRYFGEGRRNRPSHVNSGISHNFKINEHFFKMGPMNVQILREGRTKNEALAIETLLIKGHCGSQLWNIREYEPEVDRGVSRPLTGDIQA